MSLETTGKVWFAYLQSSVCLIMQTRNCFWILWFCTILLILKLILICLFAGFVQVLENLESTGILLFWIPGLSWNFRVLFWKCGRLSWNLPIYVIKPNKSRHDCCFPIKLPASLGKACEFHMVFTTNVSYCDWKCENMLQGSHIWDSFGLFRNCLYK